MSSKFEEYIRKWGLNPKHYNDKQQYFIEMLLSFKNKYPDDERISRMIAFLATHADAEISKSDIARISGYSRSQVRNIAEETPDEFFSVTNGCKHGGRKPIIYGDAFKDLLELVIQKGETCISKITQELSKKYSNITEKAVRGALKRAGLLEHIRKAQQEKQRQIFPTRFAGIWLLTPFLISLFPKIVEVFGNKGTLIRIILTLFTISFVGIARIFHIPDIQDAGLALFTGGRKILCRQTVGSFLKNVKATLVDKFMRLTEPIKQFARKVLTVSFDDHIIPRWTRLFNVSKAYSTIRGRYIKAERIFSFFEITAQKVLQIISTAGKIKISEIIPAMVASFVKIFKPHKKTTFYFDAIASYSNDTIAALINLPYKVVLRAPRKPYLMNKWKEETKGKFKTYYEPTEKKGVTRTIRVAETRTFIGDIKGGIRTIIVIEERPPKNGKNKDCWHVLFTNDERSKAYDIITGFRLRQHHEQFYRICVHDLMLDALPNGYRWQGSDKKNPVFEPKRLNLVGWIKGLTFNIIADWAKHLPDPYCKMMPFTLMRKFLFRTGTVEITADEIIVRILPFDEISALTKYIASLNKQRIRVPYLNNRVLRVEILEPGSQFCPKVPHFNNRC